MGRSLLHRSLLWPNPQCTASPMVPVAPRVLHQFHPQHWHRTLLSSELRDTEMLNSAHKPPAFSIQSVCNPANSLWTSHPAAGLDPAEEQHTCTQCHFCNGNRSLRMSEPSEGPAELKPGVVPGTSGDGSMKDGTHLPDGGTQGSPRCCQLCPLVPRGLPAAGDGAGSH